MHLNIAEPVQTGPARWHSARGVQYSREVAIVFHAHDTHLKDTVVGLLHVLCCMYFFRSRLELPVPLCCQLQSNGLNELA